MGHDDVDDGDRDDDGDDVHCDEYEAMGHEHDDGEDRNDGGDNVLGDEYDSKGMDHDDNDGIDEIVNKIMATTAVVGITMMIAIMMILKHITVNQFFYFFTFSGIPWK